MKPIRSIDKQIEYLNAIKPNSESEKSMLDGIQKNLQEYMWLKKADDRAKAALRAELAAKDAPDKKPEPEAPVTEEVAITANAPAPDPPTKAAPAAKPRF